MTRSLLTLSWQVVVSDLLHLGFAYLLALPIGWNRELEDHSAGIRTFPIVAVAACGFVMIAAAIPGVTADSYSRVLQGLITGIGFLGGGAILREKASVSGTATAASIWNIAIIGAAVGFGLYHIAIVLALLNLLTFKLLNPIKHRHDLIVTGDAQERGNGKDGI